MRRSSPWPALLLVSLLCCPELSAAAASQKGELLKRTNRPALPESSLVRVHVRRESVGVMLKDRYVSQTRVLEVTELAGVVCGPEGEVVCFVGDYWPEPGEFKIDIQVETSNGERISAVPVGVDERLSLLVIKLNPSVGKPVSYGNDAEDAVFLVAPGERGWRTQSAQILNKRSRNSCPQRSITLKGLESGNEKSWAGSVVLSQEGKFVGFMATLDTHDFSKRQMIAEFLPIKAVKSSVEQVLKVGGNIPAGWLGVTLDPSAQTRVRVTGIMPDSPAAAAGLKIGDQILELDGHPFEAFNDFPRGIRWKGPNSLAVLTVERGERRFPVEVRLGEIQHEHVTTWAIQVPEVWTEQQAPREAVRVYRTVLPAIVNLGFVVDTLPPQLAEKLKSPNSGGLLVKEVRPQSPAAAAGFQAGDVLFRINGRDILKMSDVQTLLDGESSGTLEISFVRDKQVFTWKLGRP